MHFGAHRRSLAGEDLGGFQCSRALPPPSSCSSLISKLSPTRGTWRCFSLPQGHRSTTTSHAARLSASWHRRADVPTSPAWAKDRPLLCPPSGPGDGGTWRPFLILLEPVTVTAGNQWGGAEVRRLFQPPPIPFSSSPTPLTSPLSPYTFKEISPVLTPLTCKSKCKEDVWDMWPLSHSASFFY